MTTTMDVVTKIVTLLTPLPSEERQRAVGAALMVLGETPVVSSRKEEESTNSGLGIDGSGLEARRGAHKRTRSKLIGQENMEIKATLKIQLLANDVIVAESDDPILWNRVLQTASKTSSPKLLTHFKEAETDIEAETKNYSEVTKTTVLEAGDEALERLAKALGITSAEIQGACYPKREDTYLHIDSHYWAAFKKNTPTTGPGSINATVLVGTLLTQWFKYAGLGDVTIAMITKVREALGIADTNYARNINLCPWLSKQGTVIKLNPSAINQQMRL